MKYLYQMEVFSYKTYMSFPVYSPPLLPWVVLNSNVISFSYNVVIK